MDTELTDPSGVRARGEQGSMKAWDPMGVNSVDPGWSQSITNVRVSVDSAWITSDKLGCVHVILLITVSKVSLMHQQSRM